MKIVAVLKSFVNASKDKKNTVNYLRPAKLTYYKKTQLSMQRKGHSTLQQIANWQRDCFSFYRDVDGRIDASKKRK